MRQLACWDCGFESRRWFGCLTVVSVVCCQVEVSASNRSFVQTICTECGASNSVWSWILDNEEALTHWGCYAMVKKNVYRIMSCREPMSILWMSDGYRVLLKMKLVGQIRSTRTNTCLKATLSTINPMWNDIGANPGLGGEKRGPNTMWKGKTELLQTEGEREAANCVRILWNVAVWNRWKNILGYAGGKYLMLRRRMEIQ